MTPETKIDYDKSIQTQRLHIEPLWIEYADTGAIVMISLGFVIYPLIFYTTNTLQNPTEQFIAFFVLPFFILVGVWLFYKKLKEKKLTTIQTGLDKTLNRQIVLDFCNHNSYEVIRSNKNFLIAIESDGITWPKQLTVLFDKDKIYVNVIRLNIKARMPLFLSARRITKALERFIASSKLERMT